VPYFDGRCGVKFSSIADFPDALSQFMEKLTSDQFFPREYIVERLSLEMCAERYLEFFKPIV
jgi:glycosyltransferase involved in cell wall biosynthesis